MLFNTSGKTKNEYVNEILSNDSFTNLKLDLIDLDLKIKAGDHFKFTIGDQSIRSQV